MMKSERKEKTLNAKLFVRILPSVDFHYDSIKIETNKKVLYVRCLQDLSKGAHVKNPNYWYFCTDGVFWNSCQGEVYDTVVANLIEDLLDGVRAVIICYGQTGSGKTYTASGLRYSFENRGLILRIISQLFDEEEARRDVIRICLGMSYIEFIGQNIKDLIGNKNLGSIKEVVEYPVPDEAWAWRNIFKAEMRKSYTDSAPYKGSNRGHSVLTLYIHSESLIDTDPIITHSKIHIVDMGGIDSMGTKPSSWRDKSDIGKSNVSKSLMEQLILCLTGAAWKNENHVCPYKSSQFLMYLHDTLKHKCLLRFIAHVHGNLENLPLTLSTLKFGEKIRAFKPTKLERIFQTNTELQIRTLEREYFRLKDEAELMGMLRDSPDYSNLSQERLNEIKRAAEAFLFNKLENLTLFSLGQATLTIEVFRDMYQKLVAEKDQMVKDAVATATEMIQSQMMEKNTTSAVNLIPVTQKASRRKSRQMDSQLSFGVSHRSTDSIHNLGKAHSVVQQGGVTDRRGIGIGPGKTSSTFEGNVTKAFKKLKSKKSDSVIIKGVKSTATKELGIFSSKNQMLDESSEFSVGPCIPSRDSAWRQFFNENTEWVTDLQNNVERAEENAKEAKRNYTFCLETLANVREEVNEKRVELENSMHIRHICGEKQVDAEGNLFSEELEHNLLEVIATKEMQESRAVENCHLALIDFRNAAEELADAKKTIEDSFQNFCKEHYKTIFPFDDLFLSEIKTSDAGKNVESEVDFKNQARLELYSQLQEKLNNYVPKSPRNPKKEWVKLF